MKNRLLTAALVVGLPCGAYAQHAPGGGADGEPKEEEHLFFAEQFTYDDNLFRSSDTALLSAPESPQSKEDYINRITLGVGDDIRLGRQALRARARIHDVRFRENDRLDHTAGDARVALDWRVLSSWSGSLSADYNRVLAEFANSLTLAKDIVDTHGYSASARYELGPRWSVSALGRRMKTEHSLDLRRPEDFEADVGRFGLEYATPSQHAFGLEYRFTNAEFPNGSLQTPEQRNSNYDENRVLAKLTYTATVRTRLQASFGYAERTTDGVDGQGEYSGNVWRAQLDWTPREKFSTTLQAWHELKAYVDAESDYFIADGLSLAPLWTPFRTISLGLELAYEEQEYIGSSMSLPETAGRVDEVSSALASFTWSPRANLDLHLSYRWSDRDSNRERRRYDAQTAGLMFRWRVM